MARRKGEKEIEGYWEKETAKNTAKCNVRILDYGFIIIIIRQQRLPAPLSHFFG